MTKTSQEIIEFLEKRYDINISTRNFIINTIDKAIESAYSEGKEDNGCNCYQPSCRICN